MMDRGMCTCDEEHMFTCPTSVPIIDSEKGQEGKTQLDEMLNSLLNEKVRQIIITDMARSEGSDIGDYFALPT